MSKRSIALIVVTVTASMFSPMLRAQDAKWNNIPPGRAAYKDKKPSGEAPKRNITGIWDTVQALGTSGAPEHPATGPGYDRSKGGAPDETGISRPLPYTAAGLAALKKNLPSGPGVRQVDSVLTNDPAGKCDPLGFPRDFVYQNRAMSVGTMPNRIVFMPQYGGYAREVWMDGRALPTDFGSNKDSLDPTFFGYSVGHWEDDYNLVIDTTGMKHRESPKYLATVPRYPAAVAWKTLSPTRRLW